MKSGGYLVSCEVAREICTSFTNTELNRPRSGGLVGSATGCHAGGRGFDSGWTNTQGLKITE